jgi:demethoxyubiquinone hydroxylase (CLK1/Coq7/Cat5 family)
MQADVARRKLIRQLQGAYSGELAAAFAYRGHSRSVRDAAERAHIAQIEAEEWHHREIVAGLLRELDATPSRIREVLFWCIGRTLGALCHVTGWFIPMYGAGKLERGNIVEYEEAAEYARLCGRGEMIDCILAMAEVEWEHERYFRECVTGHPLLRVFRLWDAAPPKATIRGGAATARR